MRVTLLCAFVGALALATAGNAAAPAFDSAQGAGSYNARGCMIMVPPDRELTCFPDVDRVRTFSFSAKQRGFGERASGFWTRRQAIAGGGTSTLGGRVTCLNTLGDTAVFGGVITEQSNPAGNTELVGVPFLIWVVDNGTASDGDPPDLISPEAVFPDGDPDRPLLPRAFPNVCPQPFPSLYGYFPLTSGNIVVDDQAKRGAAGIDG